MDGLPAFCLEGARRRGRTPSHRGVARIETPPPAASSRHARPRNSKSWSYGAVPHAASSHAAPRTTSGQELIAKRHGGSGSAIAPVIDRGGGSWATAAAARYAAPRNIIAHWISGQKHGVFVTSRIVLLQIPTVSAAAGGCRAQIKVFVVGPCVAKPV